VNLRRLSFAKHCAVGICAVLVSASAATHAGEGARTQPENAPAAAASYRIDEESRDERTSLIKVTFTSPVPESAVTRAFFEIARARGTPYFIKLKQMGGVDGIHWYVAGFSATREVVATEYFGFGDPLPAGIESQFVAVEDYARLLASQEAALRAAESAGMAAGPYGELVTRVAKEHRLEPALLHAVVSVESGYNAAAQSPKGARGLMQLMPDTAARYGVNDIWNPAENLRAGARYLRDLLAMFADNLPLALAAYNAGEGAVTRAGNRIPPFPETARYVPKVLLEYDRYRASKQ
jgi:soluble lytic murein transglycosylase-like protein